MDRKFIGYVVYEDNSEQFLVNSDDVAALWSNIGTDANKYKSLAAAKKVAKSISNTAKAVCLYRQGNTLWLESEE